MVVTFRLKIRIPWIVLDKKKGICSFELSEGLTKWCIVGLVLVQSFSSLSLFLFRPTLPHARVRVA